MGYVYYALSTMGLSEMDTSSAIPGLNREDVLVQRLPLAPLPEQKRIVTKVDALLERVNAARARLAKVPATLKRFRQSVLAAACSGRLTAEWRDRHPSLDSARSLLARIQAARAETAQTARERRQIEEAFSEARSSVSDDESGIGELPDSWLVCRVGAIGTVLNGSTPSRQHPEYWGGDIAWVSSGEVRNNVISQTRERITALGYSSTSVRLLPAGTVLLAMIGEGKTRGQAAILGIEATINQNIAAVQLSHGLIVPKFLWRWFQFQYEATRMQGGGSGPQALNCQRVRELPFVLPPLDEQREIVRRVDSLFDLAEGFEGHVRAATVRGERIPEAILARAFRGELVPTESELAAQEGREYESASALLERIQELRKHQKPTKRGRGGSKMTTRSGRRATKSRRPIAEVLREQGKPLTPERLFELAGFDEETVDDFYEQLRGLIQEGAVREDRPNGKDVILETVGA
jgi:type I restriction enzyme S subunit